MTFLYWTLIIVAAILGFYAIGCVVGFCVLFCYFDKCETKQLKVDIVYSLLSWGLVAIAILCWALEIEDEETSKTIKKTIEHV